MKLAEMAGFSVPSGTKILVAREEQAGPNYPYSMEKLCPVLAFYVMENEDTVLHKVVEILEHEGAGHTFAMHAQDRNVVEKFAKTVPVSRFLVNAPAALGGIGAATNLFPALTLGCGAVGGSSSSNNIGPMDLVNSRRVAWGVDSKETAVKVDSDLVELLAQKILERLR
jgi:acyl-CoA reductase-like NAD-dependent aldehyde dehydrogenase